MLFGFDVVVRVVAYFVAKNDMKYLLSASSISFFGACGLSKCIQR